MSWSIVSHFVVTYIQEDPTGCSAEMCNNLLYKVRAPFDVKSQCMVTWNMGVSLCIKVKAFSLLCPSHSFVCCWKWKQKNFKPWRSPCLSWITFPVDTWSLEKPHESPWASRLFRYSAKLTNFLLMRKMQHVFIYCICGFFMAKTYCAVLYEQWKIVQNTKLHFYY